MNYVGMGVSVTHDATGHRALKKQQNEVVIGSSGSLKHALQMTYD